MSDHRSFQRLTAGTTLLAVMNFSFSIAAFLRAMISIGSRGATLLRWGIDLLRQTVQIDLTT